CPVSAPTAGWTSGPRRSPYGDLIPPLRPPLAMLPLVAVRPPGATLAPAPLVVCISDTVPRGGCRGSGLPLPSASSVSYPAPAVGRGIVPAWAVACWHRVPTL